MRKRTIFLPIMLVGAAAAMAMQDAPPEPGPPFTADFGLENSPIFLPDGDSRFRTLEPGAYWRFEGEEADGFHVVEVTVLPRIRPVIFRVKGQRKIALTRITEEREYIDGELVEVSHNYYAWCPKSGNVYNFGEDVEHLENGRVVDRHGSWLAGKNGAQPGLLFPQSFLLGARYYQGYAPGVSLDRAENLEMGVTVTTKAGTFTDCVKLVETTPLEPDEECISVYAPGVGPVVDDELVLVEYSLSGAR